MLSAHFANKTCDFSKVLIISLAYYNVDGDIYRESVEDDNDARVGVPLILDPSLWLNASYNQQGVEVHDE